MRLTEKEKRDLLRMAGQDPGPGKQKYHATPNHYRGIRYDSRAEAARAAELDLLVQAGELLAWFRQITVALGVPENKYRPDFLVLPVPIGGALLDPWFEDVKGFETDKFRRDKKLWAAYGPLLLRIRKGGRVVETIPPGNKRFWLANVGELIGGGKQK